MALHADSLNEAGYVQQTLAAIAGRGIHVFHSEGAGGGPCEPLPWASLALS